MTSKLMQYFWIAILVLLVACGERAGNRTLVTNATDVNSTAMSAAVTIVAQTMAVMPTSTLIPTNTLLVSTASPTFPPSPTLTSLPFQVVDGLRVTYIIDGNLYVQDSGKTAIQLTNSGQDREPMFSDDGQKIVFYRESESEMNQLYVIGADGTGEYALVTPELLSPFGVGYDNFTEVHSVGFVPGTHQLLLNTHHFSINYPKKLGASPQRNYDLLLVDTDTGELKQFKAPGQGGYFLASPSGKQIAVQTPDHVEVIDVQGRIIHHNLVVYSRDNYDFTWYGYMWAPMFWTQNSSELILIQPIPLTEISTNSAGPLARTVWMYPLNGRPGQETRLRPAGPMGEALSVSPDGNWIAFSLFDIGDQDGVYLGNLRDGTSQLIYRPKLSEVTGVRDPAPLYYYGWSPDSVHFIFGNWDTRFIGNINGETTPLMGMDILGWIDNSHYFGGSILGKVDSQERVKVIELHSDLNRSESPIAFVFLGH